MKKNFLSPLFLCSALTLSLILDHQLCCAGDLSFSDPSLSVQPPAGAIGFPDRSPDMDALPGFQNPPNGYGNVPFFWWLGDPLTQERLRWEIDQLAGKGTVGLQVNYAHSDQGGLIYGYTYPSSPALFSNEWWSLFKEFQHDAAAKGMSVSLSDYTLGIGQGAFMDEALKNNPDIQGGNLRSESKEVAATDDLRWELKEKPLCVIAYPVTNGKLDSTCSLDLTKKISGTVLEWTPEKSDPQGNWKVIAVWHQRVPYTIDPMNPATGPEIIKAFFQKFEDHLPGESGKGLNFFFSDELDFRIRGNLWNKYFAHEFQQRKGYDIIPKLPALFEDIGSETVKIRLDYRDVMVTLSEEGYFKPVYNWHTSRGMIYGCDHGGRGKDLTEFGDYFRTQRWMSGPGCDQPYLQEDLIKNKVAASISHLYLRPRVWLEGFHSSGWGTSSADITKATLVNFIQGHNLLSLHGLYYSTHGGYWEWAPPCNHFRMPYWQHITPFMQCLQRMGYLLSQGVHRCDAAILYPVAALEAGMDSDGARNAAFDAGSKLYRNGYDFDFIDFESLERAEIHDGKINVSGESYSILVIPSMKAVRFSTLQKAKELAENGGIVAFTGSLPEASDRIGSNDPEITKILMEILNDISANALTKEVITYTNSAHGIGIHSIDAEHLANALHNYLQTDITSMKSPKLDDSVSYVHRTIGQRDFYFIYGAQQGDEYLFRASGHVELWDPWTGKTYACRDVIPEKHGMKIKMPLTTTQVQIFVFSEDATTINEELPLCGSDSELTLDGDWEITLKPTLDNRWGDFHWPPYDPKTGSTLMGPEARFFRYKLTSTPLNEDWTAPDFNDSQWRHERYGYGPQFWKLGPLTEHEATTELDSKILRSAEPNPERGFFAKGRTFYWQPYDFSWKSGLQDDHGRQGWHGLKEQVHDNIIALGKKKQINYNRDTAREKEEDGSVYYLRSTVLTAQDGEAWMRIGDYAPAFIWINGQPIDKDAQKISLKQGHNTILLKYTKPGKGYVVFESVREGQAAPSGIPSSEARILDPSIPAPMETLWYNQPNLLPYDCMEQQAYGYYRFTAPAGLTGFTLQTVGTPRVWVNGKTADVKNLGASETVQGTDCFRVSLPSTLTEEACVAIAIEHQPGIYGGNAIPYPIRLECGTGKTQLGDWSQQEVLRTYSGGAYYQKTFELTHEQTASKQIFLDLGKVSCSAEVWCNDKSLGVCVAPPYRFNLTGALREGNNTLKVLVYNTAANHWASIPSNYQGKLDSGLQGPVKLQFTNQAD